MHAINISSELQCQAVKYDSVHKTWGTITLQANSHPCNTPLPVDFVFLIDTSASMRVDSKLAFVQATFEYLLSKLSSNQTISLIAFNHEVRTLTNLLPCTPANKLHVIDLVKTLQATGSTNISEALFTGTAILARRSSPDRISSLMLFTDGLSNQGLSTDATLKSLAKVSLPAGCVFNTFGLGVDHDSALLQAIALRAQGVYHYVESKECIPSTFGACVAGILSTRAHHIKVQIRCRDGARVVTIATPFKISEQTVAKDYDVDLELMYGGESKSILFRFSLRAMKQPMNCHPVADIRVEYINTETCTKEVSTTPISIIRTANSIIEPMPVFLDEQINRYRAATAINEAIGLACKFQFLEAQQKLKELIQQIKRSTSGSEPYCEDLVKDLEDCVTGMSDRVSFQTGIHTAYAYSSMYFMERSCVLKSRRRTHTNEELMRHVSYGYSTSFQDAEAQVAREHAMDCVSNYCDCTA